MTTMNRTQPALPAPTHSPCLAKLSPRRQLYVRALMEAESGTQAALRAGYGADSETEKQREKAARQASYNPQGDPDVLAAIREQAAQMLHSGAVLGAKVLREIATDPMHKDRFKAGKELLMHAGFFQITERRMVVTDSRTDDEQMRKAVQLAVALGMDPRKLLGSAADGILDAEFTVVEPETAKVEDWTWQPD